MIRIFAALCVMVTAFNAHALKCGPVNPREAFQHDDKIVIVGVVQTVEILSETEDTKDRVKARYAVKVERSFKGPKKGDVITLEGRSIASWAPPTLEPLADGYMMVLQQKQQSDAYSFTLCSHVRPFRAEDAWIVDMMDAAQFYDQTLNKQKEQSND